MGDMKTPDMPIPSNVSMNAFSLAIGLCGLVCVSSCDRMKNFIDPTGSGYRKEGQPAASAEKTSAPASNSSNPSPSPAPTARSANEVIIRETPQGRILTKSDIDFQLPEIDFTIGHRAFRLVKGVHRDRSGITTVRDSTGRFWGAAIGDLNMDGADDAVLLLRTDGAEGAVVWDLAYMSNRGGRLHNVQTIRLPGDLGFGDVVIEGSEVVLTPAQEGPNVHLGYSGGELVLSPN